MVKEHLASGIDGAVDALAEFAQTSDGNTAEYCDQKHLQQIALGEGVAERVWNDRQQVSHDAFFLGARHVTGHGMRVERGRIDVEALARLQDVADQQSDGERGGGDNLEIDKSLQADPTDLGQVGHRCDTVDDRAKDHRGDHHPYQGNERVAQRFERSPGLGKEVPQQHSDGDGDQHLNVEHPVPGTRLLRRSGSRRRCAHGFLRSLCQSASVCLHGCVPWFFTFMLRLSPWRPRHVEAAPPPRDFRGDTAAQPMPLLQTFCKSLT
jgi:hypothetical protein